MFFQTQELINCLRQNVAQEICHSLPLLVGWLVGLVCFLVYIYFAYCSSENVNILICTKTAKNKQTKNKNWLPSKLKWFHFILYAHVFVHIYIYVYSLYLLLQMTRMWLPAISSGMARNMDFCLSSRMFRRVCCLSEWKRVTDSAAKRSTWVWWTHWCATGSSHLQPAVLLRIVVSWVLNHAIPDNH